MICDGESIRNVTIFMENVLKAYPNLLKTLQSITVDFSEALRGGLNAVGLEKFIINCLFHAHQMVVRSGKQQFRMMRKFYVGNTSASGQNYSHPIPMTGKIRSPCSKFVRLVQLEPTYQKMVSDFEFLALITDLVQFEKSFRQLIKRYHSGQYIEMMLAEKFKHLICGCNFTENLRTLILKTIRQALVLAQHRCVEYYRRKADLYDRMSALFLRNPLHLSRADQSTLQQAFDLWPDLEPIYFWFYNLYLYSNAHSGHVYQYFLEDLSEESWMVPEICTLVRTLRSHAVSLARYLTLCASDSSLRSSHKIRVVAEPFHRELKLDISRMYGIRNKEHFRLHFEAVYGCPLVLDCRPDWLECSPSSIWFSRC